MTTNKEESVDNIQTEIYNQFDVDLSQLEMSNGQKFIPKEWYKDIIIKSAELTKLNILNQNVNDTDRSIRFTFSTEEEAEKFYKQQFFNLGKAIKQFLKENNLKEAEFNKSMTSSSEVNGVSVIVNY